MQRFFFSLVFLSSVFTAHIAAQESTHLTVGGYGEVAMSRNYYSDNVYRYSNPTKYKDDPSHGRFDIPHAVIYLGYDFGQGWSMQTEIELEHTGTIGNNRLPVHPQSRQYVGRCQTGAVLALGAMEEYRSAVGRLH